MSTAFKPLEIPPGVVAKPTKKMRSSNWAEVNMIRWREGQLTPMGGQQQITNVSGGVDQYRFASKCRRVHSWFDINGISHIAYLCEQHLYVDTGGQVAEITPIDGLAAPSGLSAGYGDGLFSPPAPVTSLYGRPPTVGVSSASINRLPDAYSLDNFGGILYAMTSADQRLLMWDPAVGGGTISGVNASAAFTVSSAIVYTTTIPATVVAGMGVFDITTNHALGTVASVAANPATPTAQWPFYAGQSSILASPHAPGIGVGLTVTDTTTSFALGTIATYAPLTQTLTATGGWTTSYIGCFMPPNPGWGIPGLTVKDLTTTATLGSLIYYAPLNRSVLTNTSAPVNAGATSIQMAVGQNQGYYIPGLTVTDASHLPGWSATVVSYVGNTLVVDTPVPSSQVYLELTFSSGSRHVLAWTGSPTASSGATDSIQFTSGANEVITFTAPIASASSGSTDALSITGGSKLTLTANSLFAGAASDALKFVGNLMAVQAPASGRGPVPNGRCFVVTQERFVVIFGSKNDGTSAPDRLGRRFAWCDQENPGAWDYSNVVSQAGFLDIEPASPIVAADASRTGIIFWTGKKCYASRFLGFPYIYNYVELCDGATPWSPQSVVTTSALTLWMSEQGVFSYDGTSVLPVQCLLRPWIDDQIDPVAVREMSFACHLGEFNEWWWFFPTLNSAFNTRAVVYNYKEGNWSQVQMSRSAGISSSYTAYPIFADDYVAFKHEVYKGSTYANASMPVVLPFAETFDLNLGPQLMTVKQLLPDIEAIDPDTQANPQAITQAIQNLSYSVFYRNSRSVGGVESRSAGLFRSDGYVDFRVTGRDIRLRIDVGAVIQPFTIGAHLIDVVPRGDR